MSPLQPVVYVQKQSETLVRPDYCLKWKAGEFREQVALSFVFHLFSSVVMAFLAHLRLAHPRLPLSIRAIQTTADTTAQQQQPEQMHRNPATTLTTCAFDSTTLTTHTFEPTTLGHSHFGT
ncbi:hypothetical protein M378DRAFT_811838 [Amanita muscaria Koide BX008]|uniref:Uncharacterized protein n=1 Tax=Amanita muscaria (strain Koide BX008) TaxID=946122 RepID=A0A0C2SFI2_AMAMK|nr:hypothetical protein M378DRAFT_811838 [Amanita muscaria Koide BX008]